MRDDGEEQRYMTIRTKMLASGQMMLKQVGLKLETESEADVHDDTDQDNSGQGSVAMFHRLFEMANQFMETVKSHQKQATGTARKRHPSPRPTKDAGRGHAD